MFVETKMIMKQILLSLLMLTCIATVAQIKMPAPSSTQTIFQDFGLGKLELIYSRPNIKNRQLFKEGSELAPLDKVWRTGANSATRLKLTEPIEIAGKALDTGTYAIYTIPGKKEWTVIVNRGAKNWGSEYVETSDVFRVTVAAGKMKESMETFTMQFANVKAESCELHLMWGNTYVAIPLTTKVNDKLRAQVEKALSGDNVTSNTYYQAANFYYDLDKDLNKALSAVSKAVSEKSDKFWMYLLKAKIERDLGDKVAAKASAEKCIEVATAQKNDDYVRSATELIQKL
jgi:tetratricopeptide (TPR) repeat protein